MIQLSKKLQEWLTNENLHILTRIIPSGCSGYKLEWKLIEDSDYIIWSPRHYHAVGTFEHIELHAELDYIDTPLFTGIHVNYKNKDTCGCGKSFNA